LPHVGKIKKNQKKNKHEEGNSKTKSRAENQGERRGKIAAGNEGCGANPSVVVIVESLKFNISEGSATPPAATTI